MSDHGYYWVNRFEDEKLSIAYLSKGGRWSFMGPYEEWTKMIHKVGYTYPFKKLTKVQDYNDQA